MRRHALDPASLIFGLVFAGVGLTFLFGTVDLSNVPPAWSWPIPLMILGVLIILLAVRRDHAEPQAAPVQQVTAVEPVATGETDDATTAPTMTEVPTVNLPDDS
jgi:hypothetical protein